MYFLLPDMEFAIESREMSQKQVTCLASLISGGSKVTVEDIYSKLISVLDY